MNTPVAPQQGVALLLQHVRFTLDRLEEVWSEKAESHAVALEHYFAFCPRSFGLGEAVGPRTEHYCEFGHSV